MRYGQRSPKPTRAQVLLVQLLVLVQRGLRAALVTGVAAVLVAGCGVGSPTAPVGSAGQAIVGGLGAVTVTAAGTIVNRYTPLAADAVAGATTLTVTSGAALAPVASGDLVMIVQMQGAAINTTNAAAYGAVTAVNGAGLYELATVGSVTGNVVTLNSGCGLQNTYRAAAHAQVIWVPQYQTLTVSGAGTIVAPAWDGTKGGVVAIQAQTVSLQTAGAIDVAGLGFRGGVVKQQTTLPLTGAPAYATTVNTAGAEKGESIAGYHAEYDAGGGRYGIGAPANAGGGGGPHNAGGGGGANGNNGLAWTGAGVMSATVMGAAAWVLDPEYAGGLTNSSGGGRGGYSYASAAQNPLTVAPGNASWGGDDRQQHGGRGGRPLTGNPLSQIFFGGGGGAGESNNNAGTSGAPGGGIVYLVANSVDGAGTGSIVADGATAQTTLVTGGLQGNDAPGGGGGGGTVVLLAPTVTGLVVSANGGGGGLQAVTLTESEGPGGGGGGGVVAAVAALTPAIAGGSAGTTNATTLPQFPTNGATGGASGQSVAIPAGSTPPICIAADLAVTMTDVPTGDVAPGQTVTYTITVTNNGPNPTTGATVGDTFPAQLGNVTWTCVGSGCPAPSGTGNLAAVLGSLPPGAMATFTVTGTVATGAMGTLSNTVTVTPPAGVTDPDPANNTATDNNPIVCTMDAQCGAGAWCDDLASPGMGTCQPQVANDQPVPGGTCTATIGGRACVSGVCDPNGNVCGINLGDGTCATTSQCNAGVCVTTGPNTGDCEACGSDANCAAPTPACDGTTNTCVQCTVTNASACTGATPACSTATDTCVACNGDNGTTGTADCPTTTNPWCSPTGACGMCTADSDCTGGTATHGGMFCDVTTGACGTRCSMDAECPTGDWCDDLGSPGSGTCQPKTPNAQPVPGGSCTTTIGGRACVSGVCDPSGNVCGINLGDGTCVTTSQCNAGICVTTGPHGGDCEGCGSDTDCAAPTPVCDGSTSTCVQCTSTDNAACTGTTPVCGPAETCVACNGDNGTSGTADCPTQNPWCSPTGACGMCTTNSDCDGGTATHGGMFCDTTTGACGAKCAKDSDCPTGDWCDDLGSPGMGTCQPKTPNAQPVPGGTCTATIGGRACVSAVCDTDNECGYANGDGPCTTSTGPVVCRSMTCNSTGVCGPTSSGCDTDANCTGGDWCMESTHTCTPKLANGVPVPTDKPHVNPTLDGVCSAAAGALVCASGVCDPKDNECGYAAGDGPCSANAECRDDACDTSAMVCGCSSDSQCPSSDFCSSGACVPKGPLGATCTAGDQCQSDICQGGECIEVVGTGNGASCAVGPARSSGGSGAAGIFGLGLVGAAFRRRRSGRLVK